MNEGQAVESKATQSVCVQCGSQFSSMGNIETFCATCLLKIALSGGDAEYGVGPHRFDQYELITKDDGTPVELGRGAMGVTYKAFDTNLRYEVALKVIHPRYLADESSRARFLSEARAAAQLRHRNVASVFHLGSEGGEYFYAMEFLEGETIEECVRGKGPIDCATALDITLQITRALIAAGHRKFVHRDVKPSNVMLCTEADGAIVAKLIDFGLVRAITDQSANTTSLHRTGFIGTPHFASPEQFAEKPTDARSDIYSLGATFSYMLTGKVPFDGTREEIRQKQLSGALPLDQLKEIPRALADLIKRMLDVDPAKRPQSPAALKEQLSKCIAAIDTAKQKQRRRFAYSALAGAAIMIAALAAFNFRHPKLTPGAASKIAPEKSIAVLPFENLSRDVDNAFFAEGIQDEILTRLSKMAGLKVISRTSTHHFKSSPDNLPEIAQRLGVANVLEGSVQKAGDQVRVNVQLINAANDTHLWGESFDFKLTNVFDVESKVAKMVADTLQAKLTGSENRAISAQPTDNPVAYEDYLKGRYFWNKRTGNDFKAAISYFQRAIENDPNFASAYAGIADTCVLLPAFTWAASQDALPKAKVAAQKALQLDDTLAEAHTALAMVLRAYDFDYNQAAVEFKRAIELNPNYAPAHYWFGTHVLSVLGRFDEAIAEVKRAIELDPLSLVANVDLGTTYIYARRFDDAIDQLRKAIELDDNFYYAHYELGTALECKGQIDAAIAEYEKAHRLNDDPIVSSLLGRAYAMGGRRDQALNLLSQLKNESARRYVPPEGFAYIYLGLGDKEEALRWLEKDFRDRDGWNIGFIKVDPMLDPLRSDPRFEKLVASVMTTQLHAR
jgi:eukaryotic-like serine/threonine-protein kinase